MARGDIDGMEGLERTFRELGKVPQTAATSSALAGTRIAHKATKQNAPVDTGALRGGIIAKRERRRVPGKAAYDVMMDPAKNDIYQKQTKSGRRRMRIVKAVTSAKGGYYYPASQEYGYMTVDGRYIPGYRYFRRGIDEHKSEIEQKILATAQKYVDKALAKR